MKKIAIIFFIVCLISCKDKHPYNNFSLEKTEKALTFDLDAHTKNFILTLFPYTDDNGKEYLTFQNQGQNDILFYDMATCSLEFRVKPEVSGNNGVGFFIGYHVKSLDSIFLTVFGSTEMAIINREAVIVDKIPYGITDDGLSLNEYYALSTTYNPMIFLGDSLYFTPSCNRWAKVNPFAAVMNIKSRAISSFSFEYPKFEGADNKTKSGGAEIYMSRCFDGENFVYSFHYEENIRVIPKDFQSMREIPVKSSHIKKVKLLDDYGNLTFKDICENPNYGNLLYDRFRNVYYRIAYPETEIEFTGDRRMIELLQYGRKNFSIIILDKDFNIIGETLFPDYTYNSMLMFIREDGLYISDSHYLNPNFSDDILSFQRFEVVRNP